MFLLQVIKQRSLMLGVTLVFLIVSVIVSYIVSPDLDSVDEMANNGMLFISNAAKAHGVCVKASKFLRKVLYINIKDSPEITLSGISRQIVSVYSKASSECSNLDVRLMLKPSDQTAAIKTHYPIDLILYDAELANEAEKLKQSVLSLERECKLQSIDTQDILLESTTMEPESVKTYDYVALGGTFDRLHNGHKILLSQAALRATKHVTVGVTDVNMIQTKKLWELIEPVEHRIKEVLSFLKDVNPDLEYNVVPIKDLYGPTKDDPKYQLLIVSEETVRGGLKINEKRKENGLEPLELHTIALAQDPQRSSEEEDKLSSSNMRMRLLGTLLRKPEPNPNIPDWPYVIGLAGGIASGKTNIAKKLKEKGAAIVNCDIIAHELYAPGTPLNRTLSETFGDRIIMETGEVDRRQLGQIVFSDKSKLEKLNSILWPAILEEAQRRTRELGAAGARVVVMEAAVMIRAQWYHQCHQLWTVIIPPEEAIKRIQERNNLSEEEARQRVEAQPSNMEQVAPAHVVFSPYWSYEYTQSQINRAWSNLQEYLDNRK